ncbi:SDR family NAD(P)-dependent oxidoreductase [Catenulispora sp. NF23]|uniref:SDR family NAD(P)-dependent oxidoreductase n=1 Tax=Catenulispora pinistramenti TaxID=2705254 RepID=A0ABS5KU74_9ACTN|nr:SDR family NAD(P)-dependent oxidoreductase [Catenulispora pinistramenti]MBS2538172.1 SDR family NAD(P)-dependent oxidoreductase [Catenulispora pinistramenti]MBS2549606.1 SDR family NAD(P)-dependent oxidoreductase [Catenulispora pinistramenti]
MIALVTGANRGLGRETARQLLAAGHTVVIAARSEDAARDTAAALGPGAVPVRLDVTSAQDIAAAAEQLRDRFGHLDVLVNNAAIHYDTWQHAVGADLAVVREAAETNVFGPWQLIQALLPLLRAGSHQRIVNVSSGAGSLTEMTSGSTPAYSLTKAALNALTRMLAADLRPEGILVNAVCPGWVATDMGGPGGRPVHDGAAGIVWAALLPDNGPTGGFFRDGQAIDW